MMNTHTHGGCLPNFLMRRSMVLASSVMAALLFCFASPSAYANGEISFISGKAQIISSEKEARTAKKGSRIIPGETLETGADGEIHAIMDDNTVIAVRVNSRLKIEDFVANGDEKDRSILFLLRGQLRSISGWIGKIAPKNYEIRTPTATIGIRGTDHEVAVIEQGDEAGTYDKVNAGETVLKTSKGDIAIQAGKAGFAKKDGEKPPTLLTVVPPFYKPTPNEQLIDQTKAQMEKSTDERLRKRQEDIRRQGGINERGNTKIADACTRDSGASNAFYEFIRAYELGNVALIRSKMDPSMIGLQHFLDGIVRDSNRLKQMRIFLKDTQLQCGPDLTVIQTLWEKRFLDVNTFAPGLFTGRATILMHRDQSGWKFAAVAGDNPFSSQSGVTAQLTFGPSLTLAGITSVPVALPVTIEVLDPDLTGTQTLNVQIVTSQGDSETIALSETTPGRFTRSALTVSSNTPVPGNNVLEVAAGTVLTLRYIDQNPGNNRPSALLTKSLATGGSPVDTTPAPFTFVPQSNVLPSATGPVTSTSTPPTTITGINAATPISISGGMYSINGGPFTTAAGTILNGQTVAVQVINSAAALTTVMATVNIGGVIGTFSATTR